MSTNKSDTICFRLDPADRVRLQAVKYDDPAGTDVSLSEYVRTVLREYIDQYIASVQGGESVLLRRYRDGMEAAARAELEDRTRQVDALIDNSRTSAKRRVR